MKPSFVVVFLLGFAIIFFIMLGDNKTRLIKLVKVGNVVVLSNVDPESCSHQEREAASDYTHGGFSNSDGFAFDRSNSLFFYPKSRDSGSFLYK